MLNLGKVLSNPNRYPGTFIFINVILFSLLSNAITNLVLNLFGDYLKKISQINIVAWHIIVIIATLIPILFSLTGLRHWVRKLQRKDDLQLFGTVTPIVEKSEPTHRGLVIFLSKTSTGNASVAELSILHHWSESNGRLAYCWLICSDETKDVVMELISSLKNSKVPVKSIRNNNDYQNPRNKKLNESLTNDKRVIRLYCGEAYKLRSNIYNNDLSLVISKEHIDNPAYVRTLIEAIYEDAAKKELEEEDVIVDYTAGTKSFTAGVVLACAEPGRRLQYFSQVEKVKKEVKVGAEIVEKEFSVIKEVEINYRVRPVSPTY